MRCNRLARFAPFASFVGAGLMIVACQTPADKQRQADEAQGAANQQKTEAQQQAEQKIAEAQRQAQDQANRAQNKANQEKAEAQSMLMKDAGDYRIRIQKVISDGDPKVTAMTSATSKVVGTKKNDDDRLLKDVAAQRDILIADQAALANVSPPDWPALKAKVDRDLDAYDTAMSAASNHIKTPNTPSKMNAPSKPGTHAPSQTP